MIWTSELEMKTWTRGRSASATALPAWSTSSGTQRASDAMMGVRTSRQMVRTASKSPGELAAKPASMTSTPSRSSCLAISSFSGVVSPMPADCSPSRRVVSKIVTLSYAIL